MHQETFLKSIYEKNLRGLNERNESVENEGDLSTHFDNFSRYELRGLANLTLSENISQQIISILS